MANALHYGDNLGYLRDMDRRSVDLIYLDPPFNSKSSYNRIFRNPQGGEIQAQTTAFKDTWSWDQPAEVAFDEVLSSGSPAGGLLHAFRKFMGESDMMAYLAMMTVRLIELRRVLKATGSLYLHCDPTASHYLRLLLDAIFGPENFRNELIWKRTGAHGSARRWGPVHDTILFYTASDEYTWNKVWQPYEPGYVESKYRSSDERGFYQDVSLTGPGVTGGESGRPWRGHDPTRIGRHWAIPLALIENSNTLSVQERLEKLDQDGLIYFPKGGEGFPRLKQYVGAGAPVQDIISDIAAVNSQAQERLGYPTQKPLPLLERILAASSHPGDVVLDPFCGCGTTIEAAESGGRRWIGIDITHHAIDVIEGRLKATHPDADFEVTGRPCDLASALRLAERAPYEFQWWANWMLGVQNYRERKKGADKGIDGIIYFHNLPDGIGRTIVSVKAGQNIGPDMIDALGGTVGREGAELGVFVCAARPTEKMRQRAAAQGLVRIGGKQYPRIQIITAAELLDHRVPVLPVSIPTDGFSQPQRGGRDTRIAAARDFQLSFALPIAGGRAKQQPDVEEHPSGRVIAGRVAAMRR